MGIKWPKESKIYGIFGKKKIIARELKDEETLVCEISVRNLQKTKQLSEEEEEREERYSISKKKK